MPENNYITRSEHNDLFNKVYECISVIDSHITSQKDFRHYLELNFKKIDENFKEVKLSNLEKLSEIEGRIKKLEDEKIIKDSKAKTLKELEYLAANNKKNISRIIGVGASLAAIFTFFIAFFHLDKYWK